MMRVVGGLDDRSAGEIICDLRSEMWTTGSGRGYLGCSTFKKEMTMIVRWYVSDFRLGAMITTNDEEIDYR